MRDKNKKGHMVCVHQLAQQQRYDTYACKAPATLAVINGVTVNLKV